MKNNKVQHYEVNSGELCNLTFWAAVIAVILLIFV